MIALWAAIYLVGIVITAVFYLVDHGSGIGPMMRALVITGIVFGAVFAYSQGRATWILWRQRHQLYSYKAVISAITHETKAQRQASSISESLDKETYYIERLQLENIRCFSDLTLDFVAGNRVSPMTLIIGDNASGKSTVLRALALGMCPESEAAGLMKQLPGRLLRDGQSEGSITVVLRSGTKQASIHTTIAEVNGLERLRQTTTPGNLDWQNLFLCAYGTQRTADATVSREDYNRQDAVQTLFSDSANLMNPELVMLRRGPDECHAMEQVLLKVLMLDGWSIRQDDRGIELIDPSGERKQAFNAVSDGYRSTTQWVLDYLGRQILAKRFGASERAGGVLMIDEIEQHLHPRWQRHILQRVRDQFPLTQIIATTHTPLVAAGTADLAGAQLISLVRDQERTILAQEISPESLRGRRADQVLADAFGLWSTKSPASVDDIERYTALLSQRVRSESEEQDMLKLREQIVASQSGQSNPLSEQIERTVHRVMEEMALEEVERISHEPAVRQQIEEILRDAGMLETTDASEEDAR